MRYSICLAFLAFLSNCCVSSAIGILPETDKQISVTFPDFSAELRGFDEHDREPVKRWPHIINAGWGEGRGGPERNGGWLDKNWKLIDYLDRSADYTTHDYLKNRGIWYEVYGSNEYQETIHFHEDGARELLWDNGIARDMNNQRVLSPQYNTSVQWWKEKIGWDAYIVCNNAPRWSSIINYDWLTSPLLGYAISQDNIGGPTSRIGAGGHGRYCDFCNEKFFHYLKLNDRLPEFREKYSHIRDYVQDNLMDVVQQLPPITRHRFNSEEAELLAKLCAPPVMSEYQRFLYISHLHNFVRYYRDAKLLAKRLGREYDVHGNQGGGFLGPNPYQVALSDFVDTVWYESSGLSTYDIFKYGWNNSWGSFRYAIGRAMTQGERPFMSMTRFHKRSPDIVEHEMAEACAGGGVLFVNQLNFQEEDDLQRKMTEYFTFRHDHRALFAGSWNRPYAQIAIAYSVPTMMYYNYQHGAAAPPVSALAGIARALEEGHLPFDVVLLRHPEIHEDQVTLQKLKRYRLIILPHLECLADSQIQLLTQYLQAGGTLGIIGQCGVRTEDNIPRDRAPMEKWKEAGKVVDILPDRSFLPCRQKESDATREITQMAIERTRKALDNRAIISGDLPRMLWVKAWENSDGLVSIHFVNYDIDFESGEATSTQPVRLAINLPDSVQPEEAVWFTLDGNRQAMDMDIEGQKAVVTIPSVRVYGILVIGGKGLDERRSAILRGDAMLARAEMACDEDWGSSADQADSVRDMAKHCAEEDCSTREAVAYAKSAKELLNSVKQMSHDAYIAGIRKIAATDGAMLAFDFGGNEEQKPWLKAGADSVYSQDQGFGWLPESDNSVPTPEEKYYAMAHKYGGRFTTGITASRTLFWPYRESLPVPLKMNLASGTPQQFRVDIPSGEYIIRVVTTQPAWTNRNFLVSGMVSVNGGVRLLDTAHDRGAIVEREFSASAVDGKLDFTFGGATGWGVIGLVIESGGIAEDASQKSSDLLTWHVSPRYSNAEWYPITQISCEPENRLDQLPESDWTEVKAASAGFPIVNLGANTETEAGDIVYAATVIQSPAAHKAFLHFGASSQAQIWLNGSDVGYIPNEKGIRKDEFVMPLELRAGENILVVKLQRFWERHWMFYANLSQN